MKTKQMKHTPTPWRTFSSRMGSVTQIGSGEEIVAHGVKWDNADFLLRAVNSHESLLDVTTSALRYLKPISNDADTKALIRYIEDVIATVEGK